MGKRLHFAKELVRERAGGLCERCGVILTRNVDGVPDGDSARSIHHRQPKRCGGKDSVYNMVNICIGCHKAIHADEKKAALEGWIVIGRFPGKVAFNSWRGWVIPGGDGSLTLLDWATGRTRMLTPAPTTRSRRAATRQRHRTRPSRRVSRAA